MDSGPNKIVEAIAFWLIPPACREEILGDMRQRHRSSLPYFLEALHTIPCVIYSRICRTTDAVMAVAEGSSMLTAFVMAAWLIDQALISEQGGLMRMAIPPAIFLATMILADAYSNPKVRRPLRPLFAPVIGAVLAYLVQSRLGELALPAPIFAWGAAMSGLLLSTFRLLFPPIPDRPKTAKAPAFWQKLELSPLSADLNRVLLLGVIFAVIFYVLLK